MEYLVINYIKVYRTLAPGQYHLKGAVKLLEVFCLQCLKFTEIRLDSNGFLWQYLTIWPQHIPWIDFENKRDGSNYLEENTYYIDCPYHITGFIEVTLV